MSFFKENNFYILEDFDEITDEELLLHLINSAAEAKSFLILSAKIVHDFKLKDLNSRIKNIIVTAIKNPEDELVRMLLFQGLSKRQLKINDEIFNFLANNLPRDYGAIAATLEMIEISCHENKKGLTLLEAKKLIENSKISS